MENELFTNTPVPKAYLKLALPVVLSMVVTLVYNMVDTFFIALTKNTDLIAGVSVCVPLFTLMLALGDLWGLGGSSVISRLFGAGRREDGKRLSIFCFYASVLLGVVTATILLAMQHPILYFLGADDASYRYAQQYFFYLALGAPAIIFSLVPSNLLRTEGSSIASMAGSILGTVVNIILDPVFIFGLRQGAAGAAIATVIGYISSDAFFLFYIARKSEGLSLNIRNMSVSGKEFREIIAIGIPSAVTNFMQSVGMTIANRNLLPYGNEPIAMMGIALKIVSIAVLVVVGFSFGGQPLIGFTYGAQNKKRLQEVLHFAYLATCGTALVLSVLLSLTAPVLISFFIKDASLIASGAQMLRFQLAGMVFMAAATVTICLFQSIGKGLPAFLLSICRQGLLYAIVMAAFSHLFRYTGVIAAQAVTDVITFLIAMALKKIFFSIAF